jgi:hypothetical protein
VCVSSVQNSYLAEIGTVQLEFRYLSKHVGDPIFARLVSLASVSALVLEAPILLITALTFLNSPTHSFVVLSVPGGERD